MSIEQWGVLALVLALALLEGVARLRQARATRSLIGVGVDTVAPSQARRSPHSNRNAGERVLRAAGKPPTASLSAPVPPVPAAALLPSASLARPRASQESLSKGSAFEPQRPAPRPRSGDGVVQWLRPARNLRRGIIVATILASPPR